jgi:hypothetical protein
MVILFEIAVFGKQFFRKKTMKHVWLFDSLEHIKKALQKVVDNLDPEKKL